MIGCLDGNAGFGSNSRKHTAKMTVLNNVNPQR
jgi:hypothetical protein